MVRNETHDGGNDSAADNGHYEKGRAKLGVRTKVLDAECKNRGKHDGIKEAKQDDSPDRRHSGGDNRHDCAHRCGGGEKAEQLRGRTVGAQQFPGRMWTVNPLVRRQLAACAY